MFVRVYTTTQFPADTYLPVCPSVQASLCLPRRLHRWLRKNHYVGGRFRGSGCLFLVQPLSVRVVHPPLIRIVAWKQREGVKDFYGNFQGVADKGGLDSVCEFGLESLRPRSHETYYHSLELSFNF